MKAQQIPYLLCVVLVATVACAGESGSFSPEAITFFEKKIRPQLVENCQSCHGAEKQKGGLRLDSRSAVLKGGNGGVAVIPGDADKSMLMQAIRHEGDISMPPKKRLPDNVVQDFATWIQSGAAWPPDNKTKLDENAWQKHWAFQPVREVAPPPASRAEWIQTPVDAFVLAKLDAAKLTPSQRADKRTLIRRASFDLTGLPPTLDEVKAFEADTSPDSFQKVVERLLASPRYGERWGRYWLDVARYADTKGYVYDGREHRQFVHSYAYRDWVIDAFNKDMPYDEFLMKQIAGEHFAKDDPSSLAAMGFLTLGRRFLGNIHDIIDDRIDTLTRGTLGLSVSCARCHDHKFDPVPTKDYYSFYGIFLNSLERTQPLVKDPQKTEAYLAYEKGLNERIEKLQSAFKKRKEQAMQNYRSRVNEYLVALLEVSKLPSEEFYEIMNANDINPVVVRQWQTFVFKTSRDHAVLAPWHAFAELKEKDFPEKASGMAEKFAGLAGLNPRVAAAFKGTPPANMREVAERYGKLFKAAYDEWQAAHKKASDEKRPAPAALEDPAAEELRKVMFAATEIPAGTPTSVETYLVEENARVELGKLQVEIDKWIISSPGAPPHAVFLQDSETPKISRVFLRGNPRTRGEEAPPHFLKFLGGAPLKNGSGRLELAQFIASRSNPLTARVMANRVWAWHFGNGLAATPSDFGVRSEPPSHPELLDFLAAKFMQRWSVKDLHRVIMLSSVYQQSSASREENERVDPGNRLLWRMNRQRLDFESLHDSLLAVSGKLDLTMYGRPVELMKKPFSPRRTVYGLIDRMGLPGVMRVFDFPNPDMHSPQRFNTTVPQQALFFMNNAFSIEQAQAVASRPDVASLQDPDARIHRLHEILFQRRASEKHLSIARAFVQESSKEPEPPVAAPARPASAWQYGYGEFDETAGSVKTFAALPYFAGDAWQGGKKWPDERFGWVRLTADGGHCGNDRMHDAIRRWVAPANGTINIEGKLAHPHPQGDGVIARIVSSQRGVLASWTVHNHSVMTNLMGIEVQAGETIDFLVSLRSTIDYDEFTWAPVIRTMNMEWHTTRDFGKPLIPPAEKLGAWERYVQVLLLSNEFMFVD
ncbi:MAG TPA: PSD1 and planctomycete cytochrome C domain-containing protein [Planctomycetota bacterium]|nr:PSD1 and planctomycete cytochrome C domain-containing protein [Planctomycetota bacterium]